MFSSHEIAVLLDWVTNEGEFVAIALQHIWLTIELQVIVDHTHDG